MRGVGMLMFHEAITLHYRRTIRCVSNVSSSSRTNNGVGDAALRSMSLGNVAPSGVQTYS
jgi:hypothetical protein